jgi:hypothetical protein
MEYALAVVVLIAVVALIVAAPLRGGAPPPAAGETRRAELEAAKQAKYREIRDAQLDHRMGKLSDDDYRATDRELRAQAIAILEQLDQLDAARPPCATDGSASGRQGAPAGAGAPRAGEGSDAAAARPRPQGRTTL